MSEIVPKYTQHAYGIRFEGLCPSPKNDITSESLNADSKKNMPSVHSKKRSNKAKVVKKGAKVGKPTPAKAPASKKAPAKRVEETKMAPKGISTIVWHTRRTSLVIYNEKE
jgi:hypothetical protein